MEATNPIFQQNAIPVTADKKIFSTGSLQSLGNLLNITRYFNVASSNLSYMNLRGSSGIRPGPNGHCGCVSTISSALTTNLLKMACIGKRSQLAYW